MTVPDLAAIAAASTDPALDARVRAACHWLRIPYSGELTWHVASTCAEQLERGEDDVVVTTGVANEAILAVVEATKEGVAPVAPPEPEPAPVPTVEPDFQPDDDEPPAPAESVEEQEATP